ncbi:MAG: DNA replication/repair protein RecF [Armatimonadetes bacterium]|nr:DNA replication/repair protein RecF [Armatimonadota bacterium]
MIPCEDVGKIPSGRRATVRLSSRKMYLKGISLQNYRNLQPVSLGLGEGFWLILGANGQGKSNFLEAISVLCLGKARRAERDRDLIRFGEDFFRLEGKFSREERGDLESVVRLGPDGKELLIFGTPVGTLAKFIGEASCVTFSSDDVDIVLGEPTARRQFMNEALSQLSQGYIFDLARYRRCRDQKNKALKDIRERLAPVDSVEVWDQNLAQYGGRVCARRARFVRQISELSAKIYARLSAEAEGLQVSYEPNVSAPEEAPQWPEAMLQAIVEKRPEEIRRGMSLVGPQRDDLSITLNGVDGRGFASRGQARTIALALRLAQAQLMRKQTGEWPILLLDDVFAELDETRRALLSEMVSEAGQVFATAASEGDVPALEQRQMGLITLRRGQIEVEKTAEAAA